jgi:hypothetical protein
MYSSSHNQVRSSFLNLGIRLILLFCFLKVVIDQSADIGVVCVLYLVLVSLLPFKSWSLPFCEKEGVSFQFKHLGRLGLVQALLGIACDGCWGFWI